MIEEKEKNKNVLSKSKEFLLDYRYQMFLRGKSKKLYRTWENQDFRLIRLIMSVIFMFLATTFFGFVILLVIHDIYLQKKGIETDAVIIDCKEWVNPKNHDIYVSIHYEYTVNTLSYSDKVAWDSESCENVPLGTVIRIVYLALIPSDSDLIAADSNDESALIFLCFIIILVNVVPYLILLKDLPSLKEFQKLKKYGKLRKGRIIQSSISTAKDYSNREQKVLLVKYEFLSPQGLVITGQRKRFIKNIEMMSLPKVWTPVNVLYADDDCHMLL